MKRIWKFSIIISTLILVLVLAKGKPEHVVLDKTLVEAPEALTMLESKKLVDYTTEPEKARVEPVEKPESKPVPVAPPKPVAIPASGNCSLVNNYNWDARVAYGVCMAESGGNPQATNMADNHGKCIGSYGLMQIGCFWFPYFGYSLNQAYTGEVNVAVAYQIWQRQGGFGAWTTYTSGKYLRYL